MGVDRLDFCEVSRSGNQYAVVNRDRHLPDQRQRSVLEQIVNVVDGTGTGVLDWHDSVICLAGFYLIENIGELCAAALNKLFEVTGSILTCSEVGIGTFWSQEGNTRRVRVGLVQMLLQ